MYAWSAGSGISHNTQIMNVNTALKSLIYYPVMFGRNVGRKCIYINQGFPSAKLQFRFSWFLPKRILCGCVQVYKEILCVAAHHICNWKALVSNLSHLAVTESPYYASVLFLVVFC
jgi:hypothetical protein